MSKRLLLIGAGHAHLEVLHRLKIEGLRDVKVCLITPSDYQYYSGRFSGFTEGLYKLDEIRVNVRKLAKEAGVHLIKKQAVEVSPDLHKIICQDGTVYPFDACSFNIGSLSKPDQMHPFINTVKPSSQFIDQIEEIRQASHPVVVGGGAAGIEMALSIHAYKARQGIDGSVKLISSGPFLDGHGKLVTKRIRKLLDRKRIEYWEMERAETFYEDYLITNRGNKVRHSGVLWLGGAVADPLFSQSHLSVDQNGFGLVRPTLQFQGQDNLFGAGDCVTIEGHENLEKSGVYAVKQAPVLWENLKRYFYEKSLLRYEPQKEALYILSTGNRRGFMVYGPVWRHSHRIWKWKHKLDEEFLTRYK